MIFNRLKSTVLILCTTAALLTLVEVVSFYLLENGVQVKYVHEEALKIENFKIYNDFLSGQNQSDDRISKLTNYLDEWGVGKFENLEFDVKTSVPYEQKDYPRFSKEKLEVRYYGHSLLPNFDKDITLYEKNSDRVIYKAKYTTNESGWRITSEPDKEKNGPSLVFLGCSFTFGEGLNNNETFPYVLSDITGLKTYNYGVPGSSPALMLKTILKSDKPIFDPNDQNEKVLFYVYIGDHFNRVIANSKYLKYDLNFYNDPYFYLEDDQLKFENTFSEMNFFKKTFIRLLSKSSFMKVLRLSYPSIGEEQVKLFAAIIEGIKKEAMKRDETVKDFYVVIWPGEKYKNTALISELSNAGIKTINYGDIDLFNLLKNRHELKRDGHPSALTNNLLAFLLSKDLEVLVEKSRTNKVDQN
tara:strand:- start:2002 stop:3243 length:1242 start_codon:yes stop_codon:yes gene_type:complete